MSRRRLMADVVAAVEAVDVEAIGPGLPLFHVTGYPSVSEAYIFRSPDDFTWRSLFPLAGIGHRLSDRWRGNEELPPLPLIISRAFPSLCRARPN